MPAVLIVVHQFRPSWLPAGFHGPVSVEVPDLVVSGGPAYRVGYTGTRGSVLIFALGPVNSGPPVTSETVTVAGVPGRFVTIASGWWPQSAVLWQEGTWAGKPLAYTVQALGVSREELLRVAASLTAMPWSGSAGALAQAGEGGVANETVPSAPLLLLLAGSLLLTGWLGRSGPAAHGWRH